MTVRMEWFVREIVGGHHGAAYEGLQWERREHIEAEAARTEISQRKGTDETESGTYNRAIFTMILSAGKLFRTLPWVFDPKVKKPASAMVKHIIIETPVE